MLIVAILLTAAAAVAWKIDVIGASQWGRGFLDGLAAGLSFAASTAATGAIAELLTGP